MQLQDSLNSRFQSAAPPDDTTKSRTFQVLNAAFPGMSLPTIIQDVRLRISRWSPNVVVLYPTPAQYLTETRPVAARPDSSGFSAAMPVSQAFYPRIAARLRDQVKAMLPDVVLTAVRQRRISAAVAAHGPDWRFDLPPQARVEAFEDDLRSFVGTVRSIEAEPVLALHANTFQTPGKNRQEWLTAWERFYPRAPGQTIIAFDSAANEVAWRVASDSGVMVTEIPKAVNKLGEDAFADYAHFTTRGAALVAGTLAECLLSSSILH